MKWAHSETTPQKAAMAAAEIITPERSDSFPRIRKGRKFSLVGSDFVDLDPTTEKRSDESTTLLPEKYETLYEFFIAMVDSIRILQLRRTPSTFSKLCHNISSLTDRRFTLHSLAQLKHIMPELIMVEKIRVRDEETLCMKEELLITINTDGKGTSGFANLKKICRSRITDFSTNHPEGNDIPEGEIAQLFYKPKKDYELSVKNTLTTLVPVSHIAPSFKARFVSRTLSSAETPVKEDISTKTENAVSDDTIAAELKGMSTTPAKFGSTPARLMSSSITKSCNLMTPKHEANDLPNKSVRLSLNFYASHGDLEDKKADDQACVLPEKLVQSALRQEQLMAGVPKLFDMIRLLFQSIGRPIITKQELIHKIVEGHFDIVGRREVEEQLNWLIELAPECISEKSCLSGDIVLQLNRFSSPELIHAKLLEVEAK